MHLDVRPALDSPGALLVSACSSASSEWRGLAARMRNEKKSPDTQDRIAMQVRWVWSGRWRGA